MAKKDSSEETTKGLVADKLKEIDGYPMAQNTTVDGITWFKEDSYKGTSYDWLKDVFKKASKKQESPAQTPNPAPQPESAKEYGFTVEDYDYLNMPQIGATTLIIMVTTDKGDNDGIVFESEDGGDTWKYRGVTQN